jgi:hypothetical protein
MLACEVDVLGIEQDALAPTSIVRDAASEFRSVAAADDERSRRICAEINA